MRTYKGEIEHSNQKVEESKLRRFAFNSMKKAKEGLMIVTFSVALATGFTNNVYGDDNMNNDKKSKGPQIQVEAPEETSKVKNVVPRQVEENAEILRRETLKGVIDLFRADVGNKESVILDLTKYKESLGTKELHKAIEENRETLKKMGLKNVEINEIVALALFSQPAFQNTSTMELKNPGETTLSFLVYFANVKPDDEILSPNDINTVKRNMLPHNIRLRNFVDRIHSDQKVDKDKREKVTAQPLETDLKLGTSPPLIEITSDPMTARLDSFQIGTGEGASEVSLDLENSLGEEQYNNHFDEGTSTFNPMGKNGQLISVDEVDNAIISLNEKKTSLEEAGNKGTDEYNDVVSTISELERLKEELERAAKIAKGEYTAVRIGGSIVVVGKLPFSIGDEENILMPYLGIGLSLGGEWNSIQELGKPQFQVFGIVGFAASFETSEKTRLNFDVSSTITEVPSFNANMEIVYNSIAGAYITGNINTEKEYQAGGGISIYPNDLIGIQAGATYGRGDIANLGNVPYVTPNFNLNIGDVGIEFYANVPIENTKFTQYGGSVSYRLPIPTEYVDITLRFFVEGGTAKIIKE